MKDKVSPMRTPSARSTESLSARSEKQDSALDHRMKGDQLAVPKCEGLTNPERVEKQKPDGVQKTECLEITDVSENMISLRSSANGVEPKLCSRTGRDDILTEENPESPTDQDKSNEISEPAPQIPKSAMGMLKKADFMKGSKWNKLRTIVKTTTVVKQKSKRKSNLQRQDSFLKKFSTRQQRADSDEETPQEDDNDYKWRDQNVICAVIHPDGTFMFYWLAIVTVAVLYNWWTCIAREGFREIQDGWEAVWFTFDAICDIIYVLDIVVQFRTGYLEQGLMVYDSRKLRQNYYKSSNFYFDIIALFPLDIVQIFIGIHPMIRFPRFLKTYRTLRFMYMLESRAAYPNLFRVANLTHLLFLGSHWFAAFYYLISEAEGFVGDWAYPYPTGEFASVTRKYLMSLYWSTLTLTTIGDLPPPDSNWEYVFVIVSYLIGVFVFATIVGQVGNVITNRNASRQEFEKLLDGAKSYMRMHNVPPDLQKRVQRWYDYVWSRGRLNGSWDINSLGLLPDKLKTELALHVNLETLKKVTIFQECQPEFLHDLVLKMKAYIFTPGDLICRSGEIAREMFIIADGVVEVISESGTVLTQMSTGDFFGEIGILNLDGGINRRTADVRSVGYSELFVLSREDVLSALKDHPDAEKIIRDYGQKRLQEIEADRQKIKPKLIDDEDDDDDNDDSLLSPIKRHVHFNSYSPVPGHRTLSVNKSNERRKSCSVDYYRPKPVNGLVNFLQRKLSAGSAFCGVFQNPHIVAKNRGHVTGSHDSQGRTSSFAGSNDSVMSDRESMLRGNMSKVYDFYPPSEKPAGDKHQEKIKPPVKQGFNGIHYCQVGSEDASDSESSIYGPGFIDSYKLLPVEECVPAEAIAETPSSGEEVDIKFPPVFGKSENSTKIANAFLQHLVSSRRKSHDGRLNTGHNALGLRKRLASRRKTVYDDVELNLPVKNERNYNVPMVSIETVDESPDRSPSSLSTDSQMLNSSTPFQLDSSCLPSQPVTTTLCTSAPTNFCTSNNSSAPLSPPPYNLLGMKTPKPGEKTNNKSVNFSSHTASVSSSDFRLDRMIGDVQGLIVDKMNEVTNDYKSKVKKLEEENHEKEEKIQELEMRLRDLQIELSMAINANQPIS